MDISSKSFPSNRNFYLAYEYVSGDVLQVNLQRIESWGKWLRCRTIDFMAKPDKKKKKKKKQRWALRFFRASLLITLRQVFINFIIFLNKLIEVVTIFRLLRV